MAQFMSNYPLLSSQYFQQVMQSQRIELLPKEQQPQVTLYKGVFEQDKVEELLTEGAEKVDMYLCKNGEVVFVRAAQPLKEAESSEVPKVEEKEIDLEEFMEGWSSNKWTTRKKS